MPLFASTPSSWLGLIEGIAETTQNLLPVKSSQEFFAYQCDPDVVPG